MPSVSIVMVALRVAPERSAERCRISEFREPDAFAVERVAATEHGFDDHVSIRRRRPCHDVAGHVVHPAGA